MYSLAAATVPRKFMLTAAVVSTADVCIDVFDVDNPVVDVTPVACCTFVAFLLRIPVIRLSTVDVV